MSDALHCVGLLHPGWKNSDSQIVYAGGIWDFDEWKNGTVMYDIDEEEMLVNGSCLVSYANDFFRCLGLINF